MAIDYDELTDDQKSIYDDLMKLLPIRPLSEGDKINPQVKKHLERIRGVAGAGKTTLVALLVKDLLKRGYKVAMCAPTHQAADELRKKFGGNGGGSGMFGLCPDFIGTIHSLLGLKLVNSMEKQVLKKEGTPKTKIGFSTIDIVFVDELSMIGDKITEYLLKQQIEDGFHIVGCGDKYQLDPVELEDEDNITNDDKESFLFTIGSKDFNLATPTRQAAESPIIAMSAHCRDKIDFFQGIKTDIDGSVMNFVDDKTIFRLPESYMVDQYFELINGQPEYAVLNRILSFTNSNVDYYNSEVRKKIFGADVAAENEYMIDELLIMQDSSLYLNLMNSQEVIITGVKETSFELTAPLMYDRNLVIKDNKQLFNAYELTVETFEDNAESKSLIVFTDIDRKRFDNWLGKLAQYYSNLKSTNKISAAKGWTWWWDIKEQFPNVKRAFSSTIHKSQGSTFENVLIDMNSIKTCMKINKVMAYKLMYVGITRPTDKLYMAVN